MNYPTAAPADGRAAIEDVQAGGRSVDEAGELLGEVLVRAFCVDGS
ncbi:hypothetical protein [Nocardioides sp. BYT-33-1]